MATSASTSNRCSASPSSSSIEVMGVNGKSWNSSSDIESHHQCVIRDLTHLGQRLIGRVAQPRSNITGLHPITGGKEAPAQSTRLYRRHQYDGLVSLEFQQGIAGIDRIGLRFQPIQHAHLDGLAQLHRNYQFSDHSLPPGTVSNLTIRHAPE